MANRERGLAVGYAGWSFHLTPFDDKQRWEGPQTPRCKVPVKWKLKLFKLEPLQFFSETL